MDNQGTQGGSAAKDLIQQNIPTSNDSQPSKPDPILRNQVELDSDHISRDVHCSLIRGIDSTNQMPISEHVFYSSFESYENIMIAQRKILDDMMSKLSSCSAQDAGHGASGNDFSAIDNLMDKYDAIHEFSETLFDRIGQNLDDAEGLTSRNAELVQATLEAGSQNKMSSPMVSSRSKQVQFRGSRGKSDNETTPSSNMQEEREQSDDMVTETNDDEDTEMSQEEPELDQPINQLMMQHQKNLGGYFGKQRYGSSPNQRFAVLENKSIPRPQDKFKDKIDNSYRPFEPLIKTKPNAITPLRLNVEQDEFGNDFYSHPYEVEIQQFSIKPELITPVDPIEPADLYSTPFTFVDTVDELEAMFRHIEKQKVFAVDLEHHSYRSFQGITCLIQISTRTHDFVIDAINLRSELPRLNQSFTNPDIVKIFHGADSDILWLQRDFGVYVVNLFDTSRAAKLMNYAHLSLAFLLKHYCNVESDKSYQLADWRERPLPSLMLQYARSDTHYLLYIYDRLRNDLLLKGGQNMSLGRELLTNVYERGREICLKRYEKPGFSETSYLSVLKKSRATFNSKQMFAFKVLYAWRDSISRQLDESVGYVLPNNLMIRIAIYLPREPQGITALCNPMPPTLKKYLSDIHSILLKAIDVPDETSRVVTGNYLDVDPVLRSIDLDSISHNQDIAHSAGMQEGNVPGLLERVYDEKQRFDNSNEKYDPKRKNINKSPSRLYNFLETSWGKSKSKQVEFTQKQFVSPYSRYEARND